MPFSKATFAPRNYQNLLTFGQKIKTTNFATEKSKEEITKILEAEVLPILEKWNNYKLSPDYQQQVMLSGLFLFLNLCVSFFI